MKYSSALILIGIVLASLSAGCEEAVSPNLGSERPFTLWGVLNAKTGVHSIRVFTIDDELRVLENEPIQATVTSQNLESGETRVWTDSTIALDGGHARHVFWDRFPIAAGESYRIEATSSDGRTSWAEATVPGPIALQVLEPNPQLVNNTEQIVHVVGDPPALPRIDLAYRVVGFLADGTRETVYRLTISYGGRPVKRLEGWDIPIDFAEDYHEIWRSMEDQGVPNDFIELYDLELRVHVGDASWNSPHSDFDPEYLVEPGVFSNVVNGFGYVGAGYVETISWRPPEYLLARAGFDAD